MPRGTRLWRLGLVEYPVAPHVVISDYGQESSVIARCQTLFYTNDRTPDQHYRWTYSVQNVTVESWWRRLRQLCTSYWLNEFQDLEMDGQWSGDVIDRWALVAVYLPLINEDLQRAANDHNSHRIHSQRGRIRPGGQPDDLYNLPEHFGGRWCGKLVGMQDVQAAKQLFAIPEIGTTPSLPPIMEWVTKDFLQRNGIQVDRENARRLYLQIRALLNDLIA